MSYLNFSQVLEKIVAGSCLGSPMRMSLLHLYLRGMRVDSSTAWAASSIITVSKIMPELYSILEPATERVEQMSFVLRRIYKWLVRRIKIGRYILEVLYLPYF